MRPLRLLLLLACFIALPILLTFISLVTAHPRNGDTISATSSTTARLRALFTFHTPSSLFPPSAMISLTDDNTTFFIAKIADFTPPLPSKGLDGQLWIGSGFGEDIKRDDRLVVSAEGELGCSDVPGWYEETKKHPAPATAVSAQRKVANQGDVNTENIKVGEEDKKGTQAHLESDAKDNPPNAPTVDDGTDDHLHHPLPESDAASSANQEEQEKARDKGRSAAHADIQSIQESAEIAGKIVMLSRGGCGFLEKVKWAQRRGARALIVGDDARHSQLTIMYAHGDTSNITIPAVFTSHTTAHLLASLMPPESLEGPDAGQTIHSPKPTTKKSRPKTKSGEKAAPKSSKDSDATTDGMSSALASEQNLSRKGWIRSVLNAVGIGEDSSEQTSVADSRRPPSSGNIDWVLVQDFEEEDSRSKSFKPKSDTRTKGEKQAAKPAKGSDKGQKQTAGDGFVIGEQDWRDPDLLMPTDKSVKSDNEKQSHSETSKDAQTKQQDDNHNGRLKGGSITPGSGEYDNPLKSLSSNNKQKSHSKADVTAKTASAESSQGWINWLTPGSRKADHAGEPQPQDPKQRSKHDSKTLGVDNSIPSDDGETGDEIERDGLWVTLTPTSMSTSPFLDTLLVLVVSPLVTLTVVYALLLLRSRIRRRRWRAPKSVVERLPVRTYHTMGTSGISSQLSSPESSSPTTPLLRAGATSRPRPRSRTASSLPTESNAADSSTSLVSSPEKPKQSIGSRRRYRGRQVECVVCLEEYVDGESRVMSLPCGHEFHAECMYVSCYRLIKLVLTFLNSTPWLTTRRRTCPICKGDVVRSMAQIGHANPTNDDIEDTSDDVQDAVVETRNDSPSAAIPIPRGDDTDSDLERGEDGEPYSPTQPSSRRGWRNLANISLSALSGETVWRQTPVDRNR